MHAAQEKGKSYLSFLDELLEEEIACREQRRVETSLVTAQVPAGTNSLGANKS